MMRRDFLIGSAIVGASAVCGTQRAAAEEQAAQDGTMPRLTRPAKPAELHLCLQYGAIPGAEMKEKLDFLEANGFDAVETPGGKWLIDYADALAKEVQGRKLFVAAVCAGYSGDFASADPAQRQLAVDSSTPLLEKAGMLKSPGLIVCPARSKIGMSFPELRKDFVEVTGKKLAEVGKANGTSIILEPLQRGETMFLRQVADGAAIAKDIGPGCTVMGDFWHMSKEETSFMGAFISAGPLLSHVHIASLKGRKVPGVDGEADNYVDGFRGLKLIGYRGAISLEGGFPKDSDKKQLILNMVKLIRDQWAQA
jgi:sugar phosphate isomerase/epimerase